MPEDDALARIVSMADAEGLLRAGFLERFVDGLRERGRIILAGRVLPLERRLEALEKELLWRAEIHDGLETENAWRRASMAALEERIVGLEADQARATAAHDRLLEHHKTVLAARDAEIRRCREEQAKAMASHDHLFEHHRTVLAARDIEIGRWREEQARASTAHDRLLEHHRTMLKEIADRLATIVSWLPWSYRRAKATLSQLAATLRQEIP